MMDDNITGFTTVAGEASDRFEEKRSVFIGSVAPVKTEAEAIEFIRRKRKEYSDAKHNVYAYIISAEGVARYSDDGEPQGSAGMPVLDTLKKSGVTDICAVVTRYFGGTLLGVGGLVRAYSKATSIALSAAGVVTYEKYRVYELKCGYSAYQRYISELQKAEAIVDDTLFESDVIIKFAVKKKESDKLVRKICEISAGKETPVCTGERFDCR